MKLLIFGIVLSFLHFQAYCMLVSDNKQQHSKLADVLVEIIMKVFTGQSTATNIIVKDSRNLHCVADFIDELLAKFATVPKASFRLVSASRIFAVSERRRRAIAILIETFDDFTEILREISSKVFKFSGYYAVVLTDGEIPEVEDIFKLFWKRQIYNVIVIFQNQSGSIVSQTFMPFRQGSCNDTTPVTLNTNFKNEVESFFPNKMDNLHNCMVRVSIANDCKPSILIKHAKNSVKLSGRDIDIITAISEHMNFTINYTYTGTVGFFLANGSGKGSLKSLYDDEADLSICDWFPNELRLKFFDATTSYTSGPVVFIIPQGRVLTSLEKLVFVFSFPFWALILLCFLIGFITIFIVQHSSAVDQNLVFGDGVRTPYLNMFIAFIGGCQNVLPKGNFARFLLMVFLMYSLVVRTIYQAAYYNFMQRNKHQKIADTIDEMIQKDFTIYIHPGFLEFFKDADLIKNRLHKLLSCYSCL